MAGEKLAAYLKGEILRLRKMSRDSGVGSGNPLAPGGGRPRSGFACRDTAAGHDDCHKHRPQPIQYLAEGSETDVLTASPPAVTVIAVPARR